MLRCLLLLCCLVAAPAASAGAWPRAAGEGFASVAERLAWPRDFLSGPSNYTTFYLEYGLTDALTVGLDLGHSVSGARKSVAFAQVPLIDHPVWKMTAQIGMGKINEVPVTRPGLSVGRAVRINDGWGWLALDYVVEQSIYTASRDVKLDTTLGVPLPQDRRLILQVQAGKQYGDPRFARLAPSVVMPLRRLPGTYLEVGGTWGVLNEQSVGLLLGAWHEF